jgi:RimJ/RimL family protein N-acetyltransferase
VSSRYWPLVDLRLRTGDLELRPMTDADLASVADAVPDDLELDPSLPRFTVGDDHVRRGIAAHQFHWRSLGGWRPEAWRLNFVVHSGGELLGAQELEGNDFPTLRTVDTSSWLVQSARGRGVGKRMRLAVLGLAFGPLSARAAITSAWHDNAASLGVSRSLGYQPNGVALEARDDGADEMVHLRLTRADWEARGGGADVEIGGFEPCRPYFGL